MSNNPTKQCTKCKEIKELSKFSKSKHCKDGLNYCCKDCDKVKSLAYARLPLDLVPEVRVCSACKTGKPPTEFHKNKSGNDGLARLCKDCCKIKAIEYANTPCDPIPKVKTCKKCKIEKFPEEFRKAKNGKDGLSRICRECARSEIFQIMYDITLEEYNKMIEVQNGSCAICLKPETCVIKGKLVLLSVDHCHKTGMVRGLLCSQCNKGLGHFKDNPELLHRAADYLTK